jgi:hypothetical protein
VIVGDKAHLYLLVIHHLSVHGLQKLDLLADELFGSLCIKSSMRSLAISQLSAHALQAVLEYLKAVFGVLVIKLGQVRDPANGSQHCVILDGRGSRPERSHHADAFRCTERTECLVFDIAALQDDSRSLFLVSKLAT